MLLFFSKVLSVEIFIILSLPRRIFFKSENIVLTILKRQNAPIGLKSDIVCARNHRAAIAP